MTRQKRLTLVDLPAKKREHLELCVHEAAHAVAGVVYGARLRSAVVASGRVIGNQGQTSFEPDDFPGYRKPEIAYSGSYGQAKFRAGGRRPTQREFYAVLGTCGYEDDRSLTAAAAGSATGDHNARDVVPLLERCWPSVITLARKLHRDGELHHADVLAALGITDGGGLTSVQLASIRSGLRSVPPIGSKHPAPA
ncbi:hypothetical protein [Mycobacterium marinum]|uniref:hypothetical protein n=1 Tax=Mycobacterium marinum TaxID=1781 RepID=UPI00356271C4